MIPLIVGHRGASAYKPENTISSFKKAIQMKADFIELDVRATKDNKIVVMHDATIDRMTDGEGKVKNFTLKELKQFKIKEEKIPTLQEVIDAIKNKVKIIIEIKVKGIEKEVLKTVRKNKVGNDVIIASFYPSVIKNIRNIDTNIKLALIIRVFPIVRQATKLIPYPVHSTLKLKANWLMLFFKDANKDLIKKAHENNLKIGVWTIDKPYLIKKFKELNVDAIVSNRPDMVKKII